MAPFTNCRLAFLAMALAAPAAAAAQDGTYTRMSVSATQLYDGNLFATPAARGPQSDFISRFGPALEAGYVSIPLEVVARYEIQAERYLNHAGLNADVAHQDAAVALRYLPTPRLELSVDASYVWTQTPREFNRDSQLGVGRAPAERVAMGSAAAYDWSDVTKVTWDYTFGRDTMVGGFASATHGSRVGVEQRRGLRHTYRIDYQFRHVDFGDGRPVASSVITGGWRYEITPRTGFEIAVGPRVTDGTIRPEVSAVLRRQLKRGELSLAYARTELTAFGERGTIDVHRVFARGAFRPARYLTVTGTPAFTRSARDDRHVPVYALDVEAVVEATRRLSLVAWGRIGRQDGTLAGPREPIADRSFGLKFMITLPRSEHPGAGRTPS